jgi:hypothetical protein
MKLRASLVSAALLFGALPVALGASVACAAESPHAALVVDTGEGEVALCVELPDDSVSGIDLIRLAGEQHGLQYTLGYGGEAVCKLAGVGPEGDDCFADYPNFWGYWRGDGDGGWTWSSTGAGSTTVESGDVEGWSWGSGQDGNSHQQPSATTLEAVCGAPEEPGGVESEPNEASTTDKDDAGGGGAPAAGGSSGSSRPATEGGDPPEGGSRKGSEPKGRSEPKERDRSAADPEAESTEATEPTPDPEPHVALVAGSGEREEQGPPIVGLVGLGLAIGLGITAAGMTAARRRKS